MYSVWPILEVFVEDVAGTRLPKHDATSRSPASRPWAFLLKVKEAKGTSGPLMSNVQRWWTYRPVGWRGKKNSVCDDNDILPVCPLSAVGIQARFLHLSAVNLEGGKSSEAIESTALRLG